MHDFVVLIDLDASACRTMACRLRAENICCRILPAGTTADEILQSGAHGLLLAAPSTGNAADIPQMTPYLQTGLPMLCMGDAALTLCQTLGGGLSGTVQEAGVVQVQFARGDVLFDEVENSERYLPACRYMTLPADQALPAAAAEGGVLGFRVVQRDVWGLAFPLERNDPAGTQLLLNFCKNVCGCTLWWSSMVFIDRAKEAIFQAAEGGEALCALSGGVDSGVCALLAHRALGERLHCLLIDTGLMRKGEAEQVLSFYQTQAGLDLRLVDASEEFLAALAGVTAEREKDRIISDLFQQVLAREAAAIPGLTLLIRGTNYGDVQSAGLLASEPSDVPVAVIEPVRELFKEEIRHVGEMLGMPASVIQRQPFPGSGLAGRVMSTVTREKMDILREADAIFASEIVESNQHKRLWQYFAALAESPMDDGGYVVTLRAVQAIAGAGGTAARLPSDLLERVTDRILAACPQVQRVMYDLTPSKRYAQCEGRT